MKKMTLSVMAVLVSVNSASASMEFMPGQLRPIRAAEMRVTESRFGFQGVEKVNLVEYKKGGTRGALPTSLTLSYSLTDLSNNSVQREEEVEVVVDQKSYREDECGSVRYSAHLRQNAHEDSDFQRRYNVSVIDHTNSFCNKAGLLEVSVRAGSGFCGTMDATMKLEGTPYTIYYIQ